MGEAYYVNYFFAIGDFNDVKSYPSISDADVYFRIEVLSKDTFNGEHFMDACIEYELYTKEELEPYFTEWFEKYIMPPILEGKNVILKENKEYYRKECFPDEWERLVRKINEE